MCVPLNHDTTYIMYYIYKITSGYLLDQQLANQRLATQPWLSTLQRVVEDCHSCSSHRKQKPPKETPVQSQRKAEGPEAPWGVKLSVCIERLLRNWSLESIGDGNNCRYSPSGRIQLAYYGCLPFFSFFNSFSFQALY